MKLSYHDVVVFVNGERYRIADSYGIELTCNRVGGWSLWLTAADVKDWKLIGGEYTGDDFRIEIAGHVVCGKKDVKNALHKLAHDILAALGPSKK